MINSFITLPDPFPGSRAEPIGIAVDANYIYWTDQCLDGGLCGTSATGIAVDAQHVYWANKYFNGSVSFTASIGRANLDGSNADQSFITGADSFSSITGVTVDAGHIYWADNANNHTTIARADLDASNMNLTFIEAPATFIEPGN